MIKASLLFILVFVIGYLILRLSRPGISKKYDRKPDNSWSALNDGIDPTL